MSLETQDPNITNSQDTQESLDLQKSTAEQKILADTHHDLADLRAQIMGGDRAGMHDNLPPNSDGPLRDILKSQNSDSKNIDLKTIDPKNSDSQNPDSKNTSDTYLQDAENADRQLADKLSQYENPTPSPTKRDTPQSVIVAQSSSDTYSRPEDVQNGLNEQADLVQSFVANTTPSRLQNWIRSG